MLSHHRYPAVPSASLAGWYGSMTVDGAPHETLCNGKHVGTETSGGDDAHTRPVCAWAGWRPGSLPSSEIHPDVP